MALKLAINGYGRIGRCVLRALYERKQSGLDGELEIVAINELADLASLEYLTRFDSTHGRFPAQVTAGNSQLLIDGAPIQVFCEKEPQAIDWAALGIDLLLECSGQYPNRQDAMRFVQAGAPRVLFSQPMANAEAVDATIVYGINQTQLSGDERLVSNASCTTNCAVPLLSLLNREMGIDYVSITTIHSAMNDQPLIDAYHHKDLRRTRSAFQSVIPVATELARGIERLLPQLSGRIQAKAMRVPTLNVSALDIHLQTRRDSSAFEVNQILQQAATNELRGLMAYTEMPHASFDFNHDPHSAIVDGSQTSASGARLINLLAWFDNEWGFANRMLDVANYWLQLACPSVCTGKNDEPFAHARP